MPNPNVRYPLVAIPKSFFEALQRDMRKDHDSPYDIVSVNEYVQSMLNHTPMYDYLLRVRTVGPGGDQVSNVFIGDPDLNLRELDMSLKKVRVTESQFEMLRQRQSQYASDGLRIPVSCIVSSMLYQWSKSIRSLFHYEKSQGPGDMFQYYPEAWIMYDDKRERCQLRFHQKDDNKIWQNVYYSVEKHLVSPNVIVGWNPRRRA